MTSYSGSVAYLKYVSKTDKGDVKKGFEFNGVFGLGETSPARTAFTSQVIIETVGEGGKVALTPMHFEEGKFYNPADKKYYDAKIVKKEGAAPTFVNVKGHGEDKNVIEGAAAGDKVAYFSEEFQMEHVPAQGIPTIGPKMERIALVAEPRRIAVRYDQITAFQA